MRILFDQGTPVPLRQALAHHVVVTAHERGWSKLTNGQLLQVVEAAGFDLFVTTDKKLRYQQNLAGRRLSIIVLSTTSWPRIRAATHDVVVAIDSCVAEGQFIEVAVP